MRKGSGREEYGGSEEGGEPRKGGCKEWGSQRGGVRASEPIDIRN